MEWLKSVHFYRKVPRDLTEATLAGGTISLISSVVSAAPAAPAGTRSLLAAPSNPDSTVVR